MKIERVSTGIPELDKLLDGGIPKNSIVLVSGNCGSGKTTLVNYFAYDGLKRGEHVLHVTLSNTVKDVILSYDFNGLNGSKYVKDKKLIILKPYIHDFEALRRMILDALDSYNISRIIIDSFTILSSYFPTSYEVKRALLVIKHDLEKYNCTTLITSDVREDQNAFSFTEFEEFIVDGVISLRVVVDKDHMYRTIAIRKMRFTSHSMKIHRFSIVKGGHFSIK